MASRVVKIGELGAFVSGLTRDRHKAGVKAIQQTVRERGRPFIATAIQTTTPRRPFDRGTYQNSWKVVPLPDGARLYSSSPYASVIERGRRPGFGVSRAGIQALQGWARRHGMDNPLSAAFAIAAKIKKEGQPAKLVLERASKLLAAEVRKAYHAAIAGGAQ
jgi:hypothetical protein